MKYVLIAFFCSVFPFLTYSQNFSLNGFAGLSTYEGDLQQSFTTISQASYALGFTVSYKMSDHISLRTGFTYAQVKADDKKNSKLSYRNLNFKSSIAEIHLALEYYFLSLEERRLSPYIFAGIAGFHFNPYTRDTAGTKFYLQPLSTEGQGFYQNRKPYNLYQFAIPFGGGLKLTVNDNIQVGVETGIRKLFTDYLDDVSTTYADPNLILTNKGAKALELAYRGGEIQPGATYPTGLLKRGEASKNDIYIFTGVILTLRLQGKGEGQYRSHNKSSRRQTGCPSGVY